MYSPHVMTRTQIRRLCASAITALAVPTAVGLAQQVVPTRLPMYSRPAETPGSHAFLAASHESPPLDLRAAGYVEEEFLVGGTANVYDWAEDGRVTVKTPNAAYASRILVRRPADRSRFSGTVVVEPFYPARRWDWSMMWGYTHDHILERGDAWVGITLPGAIGGLRQFDPMRYASLSFKNPAPDAPCAAGRG